MKIRWRQASAMMVLGVLASVGGCQRGPSEADKPEIRDLQIEIDTGEATDDPINGGNSGSGESGDHGSSGTTAGQ